MEYLIIDILTLLAIFIIGGFTVWYIYSLCKAFVLMVIKCLN